MRVPAAGNDVFALCIGQKIHPQLPFTIGRIPGKAHAGAGVAAAVAKHHALNRHGRADRRVNLVEFAVLLRFFGMPGGENGANGA